MKSFGKWKNDTANDKQPSTLNIENRHGNSWLAVNGIWQSRIRCAPPTADQTQDGQRGM